MFATTSQMELNAVVRAQEVYLNLRLARLRLVGCGNLTSSSAFVPETQFPSGNDVAGTSPNLCLQVQLEPPFWSTLLTTSNRGTLPVLCLTTSSMSMSISSR